jgi:hypothetical protein
MQTSDLTHAASTAANQSRSFISNQLDARSTQLGDTISSAAGDLRKIAENLRSSETVSGTADFATRGADAIDRVAAYLRSADGDRLLGDIENFTRRQPWTIAVASLTAGLAASRFLKASSSRRYRSSYGNSDGSSPTTSYGDSYGTSSGTSYSTSGEMAGRTGGYSGYDG